MRRDQQLKMMKRQYESAGWVVTPNADLSVIGLDLPIRPTFLCSRGKSHLLVTVTEIHNHLTPEDFTSIQKAIEKRREIDWEIRFLDVSAEVHSLVDDVIAARLAADDPSPFDLVLDLMKKRGLANPAI